MTGIETTATACQTITIPIRTIEGFGPAVRGHLRDVLAPYPAADHEPFAISKVAKDAEPDARSYVWTGNFDDGFLDNADLSRSSRALMDRCGGAAFHLDREASLLRRPAKNMTFGFPTNAYDVIFLPQGIIIATTGPASSLVELARREDERRITPQIARRVFQVIEGRETSNHERLELLRASNAFLGAYMAQESANNPFLNEEGHQILAGISIEVVSSN